MRLRAPQSRSIPRAATTAGAGARRAPPRLQSSGAGDGGSRPRELERNRSRRDRSAVDERAFDRGSRAGTVGRRLHARDSPPARVGPVAAGSPSRGGGSRDHGRAAAGGPATRAPLVIELRRQWLRRLELEHRCPPGCPKCAAEYLDAKERSERSQEREIYAELELERSTSSSSSQRLARLER